MWVSQNSVHVLMFTVMACPFQMLIVYWLFTQKNPKKETETLGNLKTLNLKFQVQYDIETIDVYSTNV